MKTKVKNFLVANIIRLLSFLPLSAVWGIGSLVGIIGLKLSKRTANRLKRNLLLVGLCSENNVEAFAKKVAVEQAKTLVEMICLVWTHSGNFFDKFIKKTINFEEMRLTLQKNKPVVFLTPHMSNFEMALKYTASKIPREFTVLYKPSKDQMFNQLMLMGRKDGNIKPVPISRRGIFTLPKNLRDNGIAGILPDSVASSGDGVWVNFFGQKVFATTLAAKMVLLPEVDSFIVMTRRIKNGFEIEYIAYQPPSTDLTEVVQDIYRVLEQGILKSPEQYYWSYDRFRVPDHAPKEV